MRGLTLLALLLSGCPLSHGDYPGTACDKDSDCFIGQGEVCNQETRQCQVMIDAGPPPDRPIDRPADGFEFMDGDIAEGGGQ
jgi:hypothetical protein